MHEEALLRDLMRKVEAVARENGAARVVLVRLWVGALAHLSEDQLRERWALTARGTVADGARLEIEMSIDLDDPRATGFVLRSLEVRDPDGAPGAVGPDARRASS